MLQANRIIHVIWKSQGHVHVPLFDNAFESNVPSNHWEEIICCYCCCYCIFNKCYRYNVSYHSSIYYGFCKLCFRMHTTDIICMGNGSLQIARNKSTISLLTLILFISEMCSWFFWFDFVFPIVWPSVFFYQS